MQPLLNLNILQKPLLYAFGAASLLAVLYLIAGPVPLSRRPQQVRGGIDPSGSPRRNGLFVPVVCLAGGALIGGITLFVSEAWFNIFGLPLDADTHAWVIAAFAAVGLALGNLWGTRWPRKLAAIASMLL
ncbi:MAG TPA: hypothetical protein VJS86_00735, partial [Arthrobacter sp.]|nr:hypothetical protein [Arthrobacter sp.]